MQTLLTYLNGLGKADRASFVERCGTSEGYLRKAISKGQQLGEKSKRAVTCEELRPDVDWAYLRDSTPATTEA